MTSGLAIWTYRAASTWFDGKLRPRAWAFVGLGGSWADHYGMAAMYLRLNGLLPPTAKPAEKK